MKNYSEVIENIKNELIENISNIIAQDEIRLHEEDTLLCSDSSCSFVGFNNGMVVIVSDYGIFDEQELSDLLIEDLLFLYEELHFSKFKLVEKL